jgi:hypothetical protein
MGAIRNEIMILVGKPERKRPLKAPRLEWFLKRQCVRVWTGLNGLRIGSSVGIS